MEEEISFIIDSTKESMNKSISHLENELTKIRAGKANPSMLDPVSVDYYDSLTPLNQVANVNTLDARTISIQPWEKSMLEPIERAIINANIGLNPQNNGEMIMINVPPLTEERRIALVKQVKAEGEHAKVSIRNSRKEANDEIKKLQNDGLSEDRSKSLEGDVQKMTDEYGAKIDHVCDLKEKDIMTV